MKKLIVILSLVAIPTLANEAAQIVASADKIYPIPGRPTEHVSVYSDGHFEVNICSAGTAVMKCTSATTGKVGNIHAIEFNVNASINEPADTKPVLHCQAIREDAPTTTYTAYSVDGRFLDVAKLTPPCQSYFRNAAAKVLAEELNRLFPQE